MTFNITGYSTALFSTWYFIEELGLLFDAGDGVTSGLLQKSRKVKHAFIFHPDRDHLTGLLQFNQLNARAGFPIVYYPKDSNSFPALANFTQKFDPHVSGSIWQAVDKNERIDIRKDIIVETIRNGHVPTVDQIKSLSFKVFQIKRKLNADLLNLPGDEIKRIRNTKGEAATTYEVKTNLVNYSGDTPVEDYERWDGSNILIHEATFLGLEGDTIPDSNRNKHSMLEEVIKMVANIKVEKLILGHFSSRYASEQIDSSIRKLCTEYSLKIPVYRVLPGEIGRDILKGDPVNA